MRTLIACTICTLAAIAAPAAAKVKNPIKAGQYSTKQTPGVIEKNNRIRHRFILTDADATFTAGGKTFHLQSVFNFFWLKESKVPADGIVHLCFSGGAPVSPPGLPNHVAAGLVESSATSGLVPYYAATGMPVHPNVSGEDPNHFVAPSVNFTYKGKFKGVKSKKPSIKITATCDGETHTRKYTWRPLA